jgi:hypothetical protein
VLQANERVNILRQQMKRGKVGYVLRCIIHIIGHVMIILVFLILIIIILFNIILLSSSCCCSSISLL